jgi:dTDP-glucose 4,6-dehydratase
MDESSPTRPKEPRETLRHLLVTGGAGFIGANFVHSWVANHPDDRIVVLDALTYAGNLASLAPLAQHPGYRFVHGNILDSALVEGLFVDEQIDTVVHFAAESHVDRSIVRPDDFIETNIVGTHHLLRAARSAWLGRSVAPQGARFHHVSTDEVYGSLGPLDAAFTERTSYTPNSPYAASKAASDHLARAYHHTYGLPVTISNCSNNYGPYQFPEKLIPLMLANLLDGKPIPVYGDGLNIRDWLYVEDHCRGIELILDRGVVGETYNIGGGNEQKNIDIVKLLCRLVDEAFAQDHAPGAAALSQRFPRAPAASGKLSESLVAFVEDRPGHDRRYAVDASKICRELGYAPSVSFATGLARTLTWYLAHEPWWRGVIDGSYRRWIDEQYGSRPPARRTAVVE